MGIKSPLIEKEDYWAIWIGFLILIIGLMIYFIIPRAQISKQIKELNQQLALHQNDSIKTVQWYEVKDSIDHLSSGDTQVGKFISRMLMHPQKWHTNPFASFYISKRRAEELTEINKVILKSEIDRLDHLRKVALVRTLLASESAYLNEILNNEARKAINEWRDYKKQVGNKIKKADVKPFNLFERLFFLGIVFAILFGTGAKIMGSSFRKFTAGFVIVFLLAVIAHMLGNQADMKNLGFGYAIWAIAIGLLISNTLGIPEWLKESLKTEYFIKTGLVLLGAEILFGKILAIGLPGIFVAWIVTPVVLLTTYWFGQKILKIGSKSLNMTISADMSVCGVSAAIATAAACKAKKEELTLAVGMSMVFTSIMMVALPAFIKAIGMPDVLGGAWIGGTIDATGAVVAAGAFLGDDALNVAATIKMIQNVLIGVIAFGVAVYWSARVEKTDKSSVGAGEIWNRFPKFILGFLGASVLFSLLYAAIGDQEAQALIDQGVIRSFTKDLRGWFFSLAFVSIGLSVNFKELRKHFKGGKPLVLYLSGQALNLILTLVMAYLMFYVVFSEITQNI